MIAEGRSSKQISGLLDVALKTVENHRANLMAKLDMHDVASLTRYAAGRGMVALE
jgi:DNA-binding NarL/FixJ family response regulator